LALVVIGFKRMLHSLWVKQLADQIRQLPSNSPGVREKRGSSLPPCPLLAADYKIIMYGQKQKRTSTFQQELGAYLQQATSCIQN
jgi:hypothetical protein